MKKLQKGFIVPLLLVIIAVLVIGGGFYIFNNKKGADVVDVKVKAEQQIVSAEEAIKKAETTAFGQPVTFTANIIKTSDNGTKLDIDGNGQADALTDGLMILRYMFGLRGSSVATSPTGGNSDTALDIDGNSKYDALTDGLLIIRYMFGLTGTSLTSTSVSVPTNDKVSQSPNLLIPIAGVNIIAKKNPGGVAITALTDQNGSFEFTGLDSGKYDVFIAGELVKRLIVGTNGGVWRGRVIGLAVDPSDPSTYFVGSVNGGVWKSHAITATYNGDANFNSKTSSSSTNTTMRSHVYNEYDNLIIITNAKGHLASAKEAFAAGKYGEAYGEAQSAEAMIAGVRVAVADVNGDGVSDKTPPKTPPVKPSLTPSLALTANGTTGSITINSGAPVAISWTGSNLNTNILGTASGGAWSGTRSCTNTTGTPFSITNTSVGSVTRVYKLSCVGLNGSTVSSTVSVISNLAYVPPVIPTLVLKVTDTSSNTVSSGTSVTSGNTGSPLTGGVATITINSGDTIHLSSTGSNLTDLTHGFPDAGDTVAWTGGGTTYKACPSSLTTPTDYSPDFLLTNATSSPITNHYTLRCHYTPSLFISSKVDVTVNPEPSLTLTANGTPGSITVNSGDPVTISWTGTNLNTNIAGVASGAWGTGTKSCANTTGTPFSITNTNPTPITRTYTLTCTGLNSTTVSSTVSVTSNYVPPAVPALTFYIKDTNTTTVSSSSSNSPASITINSGDTIHLSSTGSDLTQLAFGVPAGDDSVNWSTGSSYKTCPNSLTTPTSYSPDFALNNTTQTAIVKKYILRCHTTADTSTYISREVDVTVNPVAPI